MSSEDKALEFLAIADQFRLGDLPTEQPHPDTVGLSHLAKNDLPYAYEQLKSLDLNLLDILLKKSNELEELARTFEEVFKSGHKVFLCGCGATGRLSLALETLWRQKHNGTELENRVVGFMAGGDVALIQSIENFEDYPEYGSRQLRELGFQSGDLLLGITEGGETPFVIGATEYAAVMAKTSKGRKPYFLYCNPDDILCEKVERSKRVIQNKDIIKLNLTVGPMALTGSTRMQATSIQMYAVGLALWFYKTGKSVIESEILSLRSSLEQVPFNFFCDFTEKESEIYHQGGYLYYETDEKLGISILTDTTERSPTFSLHPFESQTDEKKSPSLSYLYFPNSTSHEKAWFELLGREPRTLEWEDEIKRRAGRERLKGFDFSSRLVEQRESYLNGQSSFFKIYLKNDSLLFKLEDLNKEFSLMGLTELSQHIFLKMLLNAHSTLVMGRLDRYESNIMTWVRSSNNKLIDRTARYIQLLLEQKDKVISYPDIIKSIFETQKETGPEEPLVLKVVEDLAPSKL